MHYRSEIVLCTETLIVLLAELGVHSAGDVFGKENRVFLPVASGLFVVKANGVTNFVNDDVPLRLQ